MAFEAHHVNHTAEPTISAVPFLRGDPPGIKWMTNIHDLVFIGVRPTAGPPDKGGSPASHLFLTPLYPTNVHQGMSKCVVFESVSIPDWFVLQ
jgi:hypothetical protein